MRSIDCSFLLNFPAQIYVIFHSAIHKAYFFLKLPNRHVIISQTAIMSRSTLNNFCEQLPYPTSPSCETPALHSVAPAFAAQLRFCGCSRRTATKPRRESFKTGKSFAERGVCFASNSLSRRCVSYSGPVFFLSQRLPV
jgi:hypothetical protein